MKSNLAKLLLAGVLSAPLLTNPALPLAATTPAGAVAFDATTVRNLSL